MKIKLDVNNHTAHFPNTEPMSTLKLYMKAEKHTVEWVKKAIEKALEEAGKHSV